jgi:hypothetical protein
MMRVPGIGGVLLFGPGGRRRHRKHDSHCAKD